MLTGDTAEPLARGSWQDTDPISLDGRQLFVTSDRLGPYHGWLIDLTGTAAAREVTPPHALGTSPSPGGTLVAYAAAGGRGRSRRDRGGIAVVPVAGGAPRALPTEAADAAPRFTRDGAHVLFERMGAGVRQIFVVPVAGGAARALVSGMQVAPSPIDDTFVYVTERDAAGMRRVMIADLAGTAPRPLPGLEPRAWQVPRFAADGARLLFVKGYQDVVVVTVDGSAPPRTLWSAGVSSISVASWAGPGDEVIGSISAYEGDLWLADGRFP